MSILVIECVGFPLGIDSVRLPHVDFVGSVELGGRTAADRAVKNEGGYLCKLDRARQLGDLRGLIQAPSEIDSAVVVPGAWTTLILGVSSISVACSGPDPSIET
jgi:hypothetical protein